MDHTVPHRIHKKPSQPYHSKTYPNHLILRGSQTAHDYELDYHGSCNVQLLTTSHVLSWNVPTSVSNIQSFLGLAGYYLRFIEGFSKINNPMTELLEKDKEFECTSTCEASFHELKK
jgi:hypothetical protein